MSDFTADWLSLREPADRNARSVALTQHLAARITSADRPVTVLDLATGTGSNIRYLIPYLGRSQTWQAIDHDQDLLAQLPQRVGAWALSRGLIASGDRAGFSLRGGGLDCRVHTRAADLARLADVDAFQGVDVVTASALLDLVSSAWLDTVVGKCQMARAAVLFALSYDGRLTCSPSEAEDDAVRDLVNRHQRTSKGFGPALGPEAASCAVRGLQRAGYDVRTEPADWALGSGQEELQRQLIDGWALAASAVDPGMSPVIESWKARRLTHVTNGASRIVVGHLDLVGVPAGVPDREQARGR